VISTGGGVIKKEENIKQLKKQGIIIFIDRPIDDIAKDVDFVSRPLLKQNPLNLYSLYHERYPIYENSADIKVQNDGDLETLIIQIRDKIKSQF
jgi:shikimate kinase